MQKKSRKKRRWLVLNRLTRTQKRWAETSQLFIYIISCFLSFFLSYLYLCIYLCTYLFIHVFIHLLMYLFDLFIYSFTVFVIYLLSMDSAVHLLDSLSVDPSYLSRRSAFLPASLALPVAHPALHSHVRPIQQQTGPLHSAWAECHPRHVPVLRVTWDGSAAKTDRHPS